MKEVLPLFPLETDTERIFKSPANARERGKIRPLHAEAGVLCVGGKNGRHVLRPGKRRFVEQHSAEILDHALAVLVRRFPRMCGQVPEILRAVGQSERL
ncbi:MAG: hypothetical protein JW958_08980 [Candidatus Eisenbacteria bacterium]|nr:hypothetical protein [Candidatus Eisenbacteria bacterium]